MKMRKPGPGAAFASLSAPESMRVSRAPRITRTSRPIKMADALLKARLNGEAILVRSYTV
jgi:hypothetical protein